MKTLPHTNYFTYINNVLLPVNRGRCHIASIADVESGKWPKDTQLSEAVEMTETNVQLLQCLPSEDIETIEDHLGYSMKDHLDQGSVKVIYFIDTTYTLDQKWLKEVGDLYDILTERGELVISHAFHEVERPKPTPMDYYIYAQLLIEADRHPDCEVEDARFWRGLAHQCKQWGNRINQIFIDRQTLYLIEEWSGIEDTRPYTMGIERFGKYAGQGHT